MLDGTPVLDIKPCLSNVRPANYGEDGCRKPKPEKSEVGTSGLNEDHGSGFCWIKRKCYPHQTESRAYIESNHQPASIRTRNFGRNNLLGTIETPSIGSSEKARDCAFDRCEELAKVVQDVGDRDLAIAHLQIGTISANDGRGQGQHKPGCSTPRHFLVQNWDSEVYRVQVIFAARVTVTNRD
jgi:hypothetical protein